MIITSKEQLVGYTLSTEDYIIFDVGGDKLKYRVGVSHLTCVGHTNDKIFTYLGIESYKDISKFCSDAYGYKASDGIFPQSLSMDYAALTRVAVALFDEIKKVNNKTEETKTSTMVKEKKDSLPRIDIELTQNAGSDGIVFKFEVHENITRLYSKVSSGVSDSGKWEGLKFYKIPSLLSNETYKSQLSKFRLFDDFGQELIKDGKLNIAWLRTVGGNGEIEFKNMQVGLADLSMLVNNATKFIREHFEDFFSKKKITATVSVEI